MKFKAIIFDMDGTIVDTEAIWKDATKYILERRKIVLTPEEAYNLQESFHGQSVRDCCLILRTMFGLKESVYELMHEKQLYADTLYHQGVKFIDGFLPFFERAKATNIPMAIATNANSTTLSITDKALDLQGLFGPHMYCLNQVSRPKPHPEIYLFAADKIETDPQHCLVIEDSAHGISAAKAAGMFCIGINTSGNPKQLKDADLIIDHYDQLELDAL
jgi:HAD superfamily hydrolase (TIGR01509 family)